MVYKIPKRNLEKLEKQINHIRSKGGNVIFNVINNDSFIADTDNPNILYPAVEVEIEGNYKIEGWEFVGVIEHGNSGNIIRIVNTEFKDRIPESYWTAPKECEHCHSIRDRKDTYLIYDTYTDTFKQIGSTCLKLYTDGLDAGVCALMASIIKELDDINIDTFRGIGEITFNGNDVRSSLYTFVKQNGYKKDDEGFKQQLRKIVTDGPEAKASIEEMSTINNWIDNLDDNNDYLRNAKVAWNKQAVELRDVNLIASIIAVYFRNKERENNINNEYVGNVGDKITLKVKEARIIYTKPPHAFDAHPSYVWSIIDDLGRNFIWSTANANINKDDIITATIKDHKEYKGIKQTIITRGKINKDEMEEIDTNEAFTRLDEVSLDEELNLYTYEGPIYSFNNLVKSDVKLFTRAKSLRDAIKNLKWKAARSVKSRWPYFNIKEENVELFEGPTKAELEMEKEYQTMNLEDHKTCNKCGALLTDGGQCPICDLGEEDLGEDIAKLNN